MNKKILSLCLVCVSLTSCGFSQSSISGEASKRIIQTPVTTEPKLESSSYPSDWDKNYAVQTYEYISGDDASQKGYGLSIGKCGKNSPLRSTDNNEQIGFGEFFFPSYEQIKESGCDCLDAFIGAFQPVKKYCQTNQKNDKYIISFIAKNIAHEGLNTFGYHTLVYTPSRLYEITPKELVQNYDVSPAPEIYWGPSIAKLVKNYNKEHPNYDYPDATYMQLQNLVESAMEREIKSNNSIELNGLWTMFQQKIKIFKERL